MNLQDMNALQELFLEHFIKNADPISKSILNVSKSTEHDRP